MTHRDPTSCIPQGTTTLILVARCGSFRNVLLEGSPVAKMFRSTPRTFGIRRRGAFRFLDKKNNQPFESQAPQTFLSLTTVNFLNGRVRELILIVASQNNRPRLIISITRFNYAVPLGLGGSQQIQMLKIEMDPSQWIVSD